MHLTMYHVITKHFLKRTRVAPSTHLFPLPGFVVVVVSLSLPRCLLGRGPALIPLWHTTRHVTYHMTAG